MTRLKKTKQDFSKYLLPKIIVEILSWLPAQTILSCKCVCKLWCDLVSSHEFNKSLLSKSVPGLALTVKPDVMGKIIEFTNVLDIQHHNLQDLHFSTITKINFPHPTQLDITYPAIIEGSVDGLLLLEMYGSQLYLCNPITREYIDLHSQSRPFDPLRRLKGCILYGFGVTKITCQYKAVSIFYNQTARLDESECKVYTIGTGSWRSIPHHALVRYNQGHTGAFLNGNLHWLVDDLNDTPWISCFDLETELFTVFCLPPLPKGKTSIDVNLVDVEGILCVCDRDFGVDSDTITIWLMKEYGVKKSWEKEFVITSPNFKSVLVVYPIRVSKDGVILMARFRNFLIYYSSKSKTTHTICNSGGCSYVSSHAHIPTFLSLKRFEMENSVSF